MNDPYVHPTAIVETLRIGRGTRIWAFTHIMKDVSVGTNCNIGEHCFVEAGVTIGNNVTIKNGNMIWEGVTLAIFARCSITNAFAAAPPGQQAL